MRELRGDDDSQWGNSTEFDLISNSRPFNACARVRTRVRAWVAAARWCYALRIGGTKPLRFHLERIDIERCQRANISANINHSTGALTFLRQRRRSRRRSWRASVRAHALATQLNDLRETNAPVIQESECALRSGISCSSWMHPTCVCVCAEIAFALVCR